MVPVLVYDELSLVDDELPLVDDELPLVDDELPLVDDELPLVGGVAIVGKGWEGPQEVRSRMIL